MKPIPDYINNALRTVFDRYTTYLNSFGPEETYLRKKVETELGSKMIHLKMRCSGLDSEWGKVLLIFTHVYLTVSTYSCSQSCVYLQNQLIFLLNYI